MIFVISITITTLYSTNIHLMFNMTWIYICYILGLRVKVKRVNLGLD